MSSLSAPTLPFSSPYPKDKLLVIHTCISIHPNYRDYEEHSHSGITYCVFRTCFSSHAGTVPVYAEDSKTEAGVGFNVVFPLFSQSGSLSNVASVFYCRVTSNCTCSAINSDLSTIYIYLF